SPVDSVTLRSSKASASAPPSGGCADAPPAVRRRIEAPSAARDDLRMVVPLSVSETVSPRRPRDDSGRSGLDEDLALGGREKFNGRNKLEAHARSTRPVSPSRIRVGAASPPRGPGSTSSRIRPSLRRTSAARTSGGCPLGLALVETSALPAWRHSSDRKSTRLNSSHVKNLVCRLLLE